MWGTLLAVAAILVVLAVLVALRWRLARGMNVVARWLIGLLDRAPTANVPCPKCGYDCRVFDARAKSHRCPECGTELRWGHLVE